MHTEVSARVPIDLRLRHFGGVDIINFCCSINFCFSKLFLFLILNASSCFCSTLPLEGLIGIGNERLRCCLWFLHVAQTIKAKPSLISFWTCSVSYTIKWMLCVFLSVKRVVVSAYADEMKNILFPHTVVRHSLEIHYNQYYFCCAVMNRQWTVNLGWCFYAVMWYIACCSIILLFICHWFPVYRIVSWVDLL